MKNERMKEKESKPVEFLKNEKTDVSVAKEDHSEDIYRKIDVLLDPPKN